MGSKPGRKLKFNQTEVESLIQNFHQILESAAANYNPRRGFPTLERLRIEAGITPINPKSNPWVVQLGQSYQRVRLRVQGPGDWQNRFKDKRNLSTAELDELICSLLALYGPLTIEQVDSYLMMARGTHRRNLAVVVRRIKAMTIAGRIKKVDRKYTIEDRRL